MTCVVFGGTRGIGAAVSRLFLQKQFKVAIASSNPENVTSFCESARVSSNEESPIIGRACDVSDEKDVNDFVAFVLSEFKHIDVLVNAAGISRDGLLLKVKRKDIDELINVNLIGSINTCKAVIKPMIQKKQGCIINFGSIVGRSGNPGQSIYSATKSGLEGFTKSLAKEVASRGVRANVIAPGFIKTEMTERVVKQNKISSLIPLGRFGEPEEVADLAYFLTTASYITGQVLNVDGGLQL